MYSELYIVFRVAYTKVTFLVMPRLVQLMHILQRRMQSCTLVPLACRGWCHPDRKGQSGTVASIPKTPKFQSEELSVCVHGQPVSVFSKDYIAGGSSSGSCVNVASKQVSFSLATDTADSGRELG
jgi:hypothetical protein